MTLTFSVSSLSMLLDESENVSITIRYGCNFSFFLWGGGGSMI